MFQGLAGQTKVDKKDLKNAHTPRDDRPKRACARSGINNKKKNSSSTQHLVEHAARGNIAESYFGACHTQQKKRHRS